MSAPLVPLHVDLRSFRWVPIDRVRLFASTFNAQASDSEWRVGFILWLKSWDQVPAGSLPSDDAELCRLVELGRDLKTWRKLKAMALHGWALCDDGRLYHSVVAEIVTHAWERKEAQRNRTESARNKRLSQRNRDAQPSLLQTEKSVSKASMHKREGEAQTDELSVLMGNREPNGSLPPSRARARVGRGGNRQKSARMTQAEGFLHAALAPPRHC